MLIDSHAHLNFQAFDADRPEVIARCLGADMVVINVGSQTATSLGAIKLAQENKNFFAAVGIHPIHIGDNRHDPIETAGQQSATDLPEAFDKIAVLARENKVVAIGETGLDYFRLTGNSAVTKNLQREYFIKHLALARSLNLPVILHCRSLDEERVATYEEIFSLVKEHGVRGVVHCFGGTMKITEKFIELGFYFGFTGIITFKKGAEELQGIAQQLPLDKILIETDCPYLTPEPRRGERNEPIYVRYVAEKIAALKSITVEEVIRATDENARCLFNLSLS